MGGSDIAICRVRIKLEGVINVKCENSYQLEELWKEKALPRPSYLHLQHLQLTLRFNPILTVYYGHIITQQPGGPEVLNEHLFSKWGNMDGAKDDEYHAQHVLCAQEEQLFALFKIVI